MQLLFQRQPRVVLSPRIARYARLLIANSIVELPRTQVTLSIAKTMLCFHTNLVNMTCNWQLQVYAKPYEHDL